MNHRNITRYISGFGLIIAVIFVMIYYPNIIHWLTIPLILFTVLDVVIYVRKTLHKTSDSKTIKPNETNVGRIDEIEKKVKK